MSYHKNTKDSVKGLKGCVLCRIGLLRFSYYKLNTLYSHHLNGSQKDKYGNKSGRTVKLCSNHHGMVHGYIKQRAIDLAIQTNPNFYKDCFYELLRRK